MGRALLPRLQGYDVSQLACVLCDLVAAGRLSDTSVLDALPPLRPAADDAMVAEVEAVAEAEAPAVMAMQVDGSGGGGADGGEGEGGKAPLRSIDATTRGVGGGAVTSVGEENLLDGPSDPHYPQESVLVHEFGHTVMNLGLSPEVRALVRLCHDDAVSRGLYPPRCYMASNADEYWAEGTQSWFDATVRRDVNGGIDSRERLRAHDPALALLLRHAYGHAAWRYAEAMDEGAREVWREQRARPREPSSSQQKQQQQRRQTAAGGPEPMAQEPPPPGTSGLRLRPPQSEEEEERMIAMALAESMETQTSSMGSISRPERL